MNLSSEVEMQTLIERIESSATTSAKQEVAAKMKELHEAFLKKDKAAIAKILLEITTCEYVSSDPLLKKIIESIQVF
jgi:phenylpyruvate tautomerase PptA (4-oxalocrotonate tautomerase family)